MGIRQWKEPSTFYSASVRSSMGRHQATQQQPPLIKPWTLFQPEIWARPKAAHLSTLKQEGMPICRVARDILTWAIQWPLQRQRVLARTSRRKCLGQRGQDFIEIHYIILHLISKDCRQNEINIIFSSWACSMDIIPRILVLLALYMTEYSSELSFESGPDPYTQLHPA